MNLLSSQISSANMAETLINDLNHITLTTGQDLETLICQNTDLRQKSETLMLMNEELQQNASKMSSDQETLRYKFSMLLDQFQEFIGS